jgi:hypothetical protein
MSEPQPGISSDMVTEEEWESTLRRLQEEDRRNLAAIRHDARAIFRAMERWGFIHSEEQWQQACDAAQRQYESGRFLIGELGAERYLAPELMATLWMLRQHLLDQFDVHGPAETMLVDLAILGYYNTLRVQGWIGNAALTIEHEFFREDSPTAKLKQQYGYTVEGLRVEEIVERLVHELVPLLDRCNRMFIRNLRAIKDLRAPAGPAVAITQAGQVNVGTHQVNAMTSGEPRPAASVASPPGHSMANAESRPDGPQSRRRRRRSGANSEA